MKNKPIYFDYAAATPLDEAVNQAMMPYLTDQFYNPSANYAAARQVRADINQARATIARLVGARPAEIIFTSGATEANNLAIAGLRQQFPKAEILVSTQEHDSVRLPAATVGAKFIPSTSAGLVDLAWLAKHLNKNTVLISTILVSNEIGVIQPVREIAALVAAERRRRLAAREKLPIYLHSDAAQAGNYLDLSVARLGVDLMTVNGGKLYGPKQTGFLYYKAGLKLKPQILGGGQEFGLRAGTENVAGIIGLAKAFELAHQRRQAESRRLTELRRRLERAIIEAYPKAHINGARSGRAPHIINVSFSGQDNEALLYKLDEAGIVVATGSACSAGKGELSPALSAMGLARADVTSAIRISLGRGTDEADVERLAKAIKTSLA